MKITISDLCKSYGGLPVLNRVTMELETGARYCLMGPSGSGKTTFFRILMGLEEADFGTFTFPDHTRISAVFQEDRLCETFTPIDNVAMVLPETGLKARERAERELLKLLPVRSLNQPVYTLSGGMKRRCAICRALMSPFDLLLMDEPFTGLDSETKNHVIAYVKEMTLQKTVIISTHQEEDLLLMDSTLIRLTSSRASDGTV